MPPRIPRACRVSGCSNTTIERHGYCEQHADKARAFANRKGSGRGGRPWRRLRDKVKARANGLCEECGKHGRVKVGEFCDHIANTAEGGTDDLSNLQWLCKPCHDKKTQQESQRGRARASGGGAG